MKLLDTAKRWLSRPPKESTGGLVVPTQRTALNLREIRLRDGVVVLRTGEARAFLRVTGFTAHHKSEADCLVFLQRYAAALNTLPGNAVLIVRSRPGGLDRSVRQIEAQTLALHKTGSALAPLAADQLAHARRTHESGVTRRTDQYVALHSPKGNTARLLAAAETVRAHLAGAGCAAELVTDRDLAHTLAEDWRPEMPAGFHQEILFPQDSNTVLAVIQYAPRNTHVAAPRKVA